MQPGVSTACLYPQLLEDSLYELAVNGITHVEIFFNADQELRRKFVSNLSDIMTRFGVTCRSVHPFACPMEPMMLFSRYERRVEEMISYYKRTFDAMHTLGAEIFVFHGNDAQHPVPVDLYCERFARLVQAGKEEGIIVAQENVERCQSRSLRFLREMALRMGSEVRFVLDTKQAVRSGESPEEILATLGSRVVHVHISDHGEKGDCLPLGSGSFRIRSFLEQLDKCSPECSVILELYRSNFRGISDLVSNYRMLSMLMRRRNTEE
ncbi:MAG: sugar phosphate isomerase/epimerase [Oscillospiraceae bacterium]|nr:sugar phosphate isomerase/epimerase [Oscillospiraceae bacterium]MBQ9110900.1 sugar phosphate isomerase/epimerase [Oscillospiraceae bacterium]